jgi:hypothetical protein
MITQTEAKNLLEERKQRIIDDSVKFPHKGDKITIPIRSCDKDHLFLLDVNNTSATQIKLSYQTRKDENIILIRIDINGAHLNPYKKQVPLDVFNNFNGKRIIGTHVHLYTEKYNDKWAIPISVNFQEKNKTEFDILEYFYSLCTIIKPPVFEYGLAI